MDYKNIAQLWQEVVEGKKKKLDAVDPEALKGKFSDRKDKDIDNDGDVDKSDEYLHNRRQAIKKNMAENGDDDDKMDKNGMKKCEECGGSTINHNEECSKYSTEKKEGNKMKKESVRHAKWGHGEIISESAEGIDVLFEHGVEFNVPSDQLEGVMRAVKVAKKMGGNMTGATKKIEKMKKGMSDNPRVAKALQKANEATMADKDGPGKGKDMRDMSKVDHAIARDYHQYRVKSKGDYHSKMAKIHHANAIGGSSMLHKEGYIGAKGEKGRDYHNAGTFDKDTAYSHAKKHDGVVHADPSGKYLVKHGRGKHVQESVVETVVEKEKEVVDSYNKVISNTRAALMQMWEASQEVVKSSKTNVDGTMKHVKKAPHGSEEDNQDSQKKQLKRSKGEEDFINKHTLDVIDGEVAEVDAIVKAQADAVKSQAPNRGNDNRKGDTKIINKPAGVK